MCRRLKRVRALLEHLSEKGEEAENYVNETKRRCIERLPPSDRAVLLATTSDSSSLADDNTILMPDLSRLLASLEDDVVVNELTAKARIVYIVDRNSVLANTDPSSEFCRWGLISRRFGPVLRNFD